MSIPAPQINYYSGPPLVQEFYQPAINPEPIIYPNVNQDAYSLPINQEPIICTNAIQEVYPLLTSQEPIVYSNVRQEAYPISINQQPVIQNLNIGPPNNYSFADNGIYQLPETRQDFSQYKQQVYQQPQNIPMNGVLIRDEIIPLNQKHRKKLQEPKNVWSKVVQIPSNAPPTKILVKIQPVP